MDKNGREWTMDDYGIWKALDDYGMTMDDWMTGWLWRRVTGFCRHCPSESFLSSIPLLFFVQLAGLRTPHAHRHRRVDSPVTKLLLVHINTVVGNTSWAIWHVCNDARYSCCATNNEIHELYSPQVRLAAHVFKCAILWVAFPKVMPPRPQLLKQWWNWRWVRFLVFEFSASALAVECIRNLSKKSKRHLRIFGQFGSLGSCVWLVLSNAHDTSPGNFADAIYDYLRCFVQDLWSFRMMLLRAFANQQSDLLMQFVWKSVRTLQYFAIVHVVLLNSNCTNCTLSRLKICFAPGFRKWPWSPVRSSQP